MKKIKLTQNKYALIDDTDFELVSKYKWYFQKGGVHTKNGYAVAEKYDKEFYSKFKKTRHTYYRMHNLIMNTPKGLQVDHINHVGTDNRRNNLRICTKKENHYNQPPRKNETGYRGVYKEWNKFSVKVVKDGKKYTQYKFVTEKEAAMAYNKLAQRLFGEFAVLNKI